MTGARRWSSLPFVLAAGFVACQAYWRYAEQSRTAKVRTRTGATLIKAFDLRGADSVMALIKRRESDDFRQRVRERQGKLTYWPGLRSAQVSWRWMEMLNGLHTETSFQGDYSWLFSRLDFLSRSVGARGDWRVISLAPFFLVIGSDGIGSTLLIRDWIQRYPNYWKTWFFAGYHALENLKLPLLAADYYERGLKFREMPDYVAALVLRLRAKDSLGDTTSRDMVLKGLDPEVLDRLKRARPEWFQ